LPWAVFVGAWAGASAGGWFPALCPISPGQLPFCPDNPFLPDMITCVFPITFPAAGRLALIAGYFLSGALFLRGQQPGCTDPQAVNFEPAALVNDGSCLYPPTVYSTFLLTPLSDTVRETSGLAFVGGMLWTHGDSGFPPRLYGVDTLNGTVLRRVQLAGTVNTDWEDMAQSATHLFIGDFGNNNGSRSDLRILRIPLDSLIMPDTDTLWPELIRFHYPEQTDFSAAPNQTPWDAEAFYHAGDSLHLFTKDWLQQRTRYYTIPDSPGDHAARLRDSFDVQGLITGAARNPEGDEVVLCGYRNIGAGIWTCFAWLLFDYPAHHPLAGNRRRIELGTALQLGQLEGVWLKPDRSGWMSGEAISAGPFQQAARLSGFDFRSFFDHEPLSTGPARSLENMLRLFPNPGNGLLFWEVEEGLLHRSWRLTDGMGRMALQGTFSSALGVIDTGDLPPGIWYLQVDGDRPLTRVVRLGP